MDKGVGQRGSGDRSAEAARTEGPKSLLADKVDSGADLFLAGTEQEDEQRLRAATGERRGPHLRGDEPPYGEAFGSFMRLFRRFHGEVQLRRIPLPRTPVHKGKRKGRGCLEVSVSSRAVEASDYLG